MSRPVLAQATLERLPARVARPAYDRGSVRSGVVHFAPGAFHRAHQAWFFDRMLSVDAGYGICAVALRSSEVVDALAPQDGLYTLVEQGAEPRLQVVGAITSLLHAPSAPSAVLARLADPGVRLVTATVTEKGYCLTPRGDLDLAHPDIRHDLTSEVPRSFIGWLCAGLRARRAAGAGGLKALSCDNLSGNGARLKRATLQFAEAAGDGELARWIEGEVRFPSTMVDSITPATDASLRELVEARLGLHDAWPVQREPFAQWVIEDALGADTGAFAAAGVTVTGEVAAFERAKLRLLNGAHSTLAYLGLALGHATVTEAMADPPLAAFVERLMRRDIVPTLGRAAGLDLDAYVGQVLGRFRNPGIAHRLSQIAWDGSQKLPFRLLGTLGDALAAGRPVDRLAVGVAAWMAFVRARAKAGETITDPLAERLAQIGRAASAEPAADVAAFLGLAEVFPPALSADPRFVQALETAYAALLGPSPRTLLSL